MVGFFTKKRARIIFLVYSLCIINFVIFKFTGNVEQVVTRIEGNIFQRNMGYWNINLNPMITINSYLRSFQNNGVSYEMLYFIGNILIFLPMGFLVPLLMKRQSYMKTIIWCFFIILGIELIQVSTYLGSADVTDVILNLIGCSIGYMGNRIYCDIEQNFLKRRSIDS